MPKPKVDTLRFERVHRTKTRVANSSKQRPIIADFSFYQEKWEVFSFAKNLKCTGISIGDSYPVEINNIHRKLLLVLKAAKREKKKAFFKVDNWSLIIPYTEVKKLRVCPFTGILCELSAMARVNLKDNQFELKNYASWKLELLLTLASGKYQLAWNADQV